MTPATQETEARVLQAQISPSYRASSSTLDNLVRSRLKTKRQNKRDWTRSSMVGQWPNMHEAQSKFLESTNQLININAMGVW